MEKRTCKLCFKTFSNGRALGGHMRSHMVKLQTPLPLPVPATPTQTHPSSSHQLIENETDSTSSSSFSSFEEDDKGLSYGLRENPKKSFRLVDPEFSSFVVVDAGSVVQDRESETEESSKNPSRRRSKRNRKSGLFDLGLGNQDEEHRMNMMLMMMNKKSKLSNSGGGEVEPEPVSSVSDTTPEEDVAWCLMMLSRGIRTRRNADDEDEDEQKSIEESDDEEEEMEEEIKIRVKRSRGKYQCGTCKKFFRSYQALGGHRASHKKIKGCNTYSPTIEAATATEYEPQQQGGNVGSVTVTNTTNSRIHECPVCFRVFGSGQALGGHKRSHITGSSPSTILQQVQPTRNPAPRENLIDLNLPAPMEDEDQIELSAVSDAEFVDRFN